jgi:hypothetical protein
MENDSPKELQNQDDVSPSEQLEKIIVEQPDLEHPPKTSGTGSNRPVFNDGSVIIKKDKGDDGRDRVNIEP